ncbi:MAG: DUF3307 domain-containing protein [Verrucomicrobiota bacterium JB023]|nr:DUF3307 domain-containing protein [Verrucomicrobiota bacterium JB023]
MFSSITFDLQLLVPLLLGHSIGDFLLQSDKMVANKNRFGTLLLHILLVMVATGLALLVAGYAPIPTIRLTVAIGLSHGLIDLLKIKVLSARLSPPNSFWLDQGLHLLVILFLCSDLAIARMIQPADFPHLTPEMLAWHVELLGRARVLTIALGALLAIKAGSHVVALHVTHFLDQIEEQERQDSTLVKKGKARGLQGAGKAIGMLERTLIFLLVLAGHPASVSFLIAAKSIFRFGELKDSENRQEAEYITIGTLASFAWALAIAILTQWLLTKLVLA